MGKLSIHSSNVPTQTIQTPPKKTSLPEQMDQSQFQLTKNPVTSDPSLSAITTTTQVSG